MKKTRSSLTLDQLIKDANIAARDLDNILREILGRRKEEVLIHPRNAEYLVESLQALSGTVAKLSKTDYVQALDENLKKRDALNKKAADIKEKYKK